VHGVGAALAGDVQQFFFVQKGVCRAVTVKPPGLVGHACVQGVDVGIGIHGDGLHAVVAAGAHHTDGDLAPIGNQNLLHDFKPFAFSECWMARTPSPAAQAPQCDETPAARSFSPRLAMRTFFMAFKDG
jgi:hypothetical protein